MVGKTGNPTIGCDEFNERGSIGFGQGWGWAQKEDTNSAWSGVKKEQCQRRGPLKLNLERWEGWGRIFQAERVGNGKAVISHDGFMSRGNVLLNARISVFRIGKVFHGELKKQKRT